MSLLEFRYDISDTAPIYSKGIEAEANRLLEGLMDIHKDRHVRAPCELSTLKITELGIASPSHVCYARHRWCNRSDGELVLDHCISIINSIQRPY